MSSLPKVLSVLETVVAHQAAGVTFSEVSRLSGLAKASAHRTLKELVESGYLTYDPDSKRYRGGLKLGTLGSEVMANFGLRDHVHPHLLKMRQETGHTCNMAIRQGDIGIYVDKVESQDYGIKLIAEVGRSFPLYCTGLGKCLLAWAPDRVVESILKGFLEKFTENTIVDPERVMAQLSEIREKGYAVDREEITRGIMCVAAPIFGIGNGGIGNGGIGNGVIAAISMAFPAYVCSDRGIDQEIEVILRYAQRIGGALK